MEKEIGKIVDNTIIVLTTKVLLIKKNATPITCEEARIKNQHTIFKSNFPSTSMFFKRIEDSIQ